jgi:hypothetical protein
MDELDVKVSPRPLLDRDDDDRVSRAQPSNFSSREG